MIVKLEQRLKQLDKELYGYYKIKHCGNCIHCQQALDKIFTHCKCIFAGEQVSWFKIACREFVNKHQKFIKKIEKELETRRQIWEK